MSSIHPSDKFLDQNQPQKLLFGAGYRDKESMKERHVQDNLCEGVKRIIPPVRCC